MTMLRSLVLFTSIIILSACGTTGQSYNAQLLPNIPKGNAQLVMYRPFSLMGMAESPTMYVNGVPTCEISSGSFIVTNTNAGTVKISSSLYGGTVKSGLVTEAHPGKRYFIKVAPNAGIAIGGGFGAAGALAGSVEDSSVYQIRLIEDNIAEQEVIGTKQSTTCK